MAALWQAEKVPGLKRRLDQLTSPWRQEAAGPGVGPGSSTGESLVECRLVLSLLAEEARERDVAQSFQDGAQLDHMVDLLTAFTRAIPMTEVSRGREHSQKISVLSQPFIGVP